LVGRLKIADFMMMPVQRLTKYHILLDKIQQYTDDESIKKEIYFMKDCVNSVPHLINEKLNYIDQFDRIADSIEKYEGIIGPNDEINQVIIDY
jgi:hypothetical protein